MSRNIKYFVIANLRARKLYGEWFRKSVSVIVLFFDFW